MAQPSKILCLAVFVPTLLLPARAAAQGAPPAETDSQQAAKDPKVRLADAYGRLPLSFETNQGQTDRRVKFLSRSAGKTLFLTSTEAVLVLASREKNDQGSSRMGNAKSLTSRESVLRMKLLGANRDAEVTGLERLPGKSNYFIGNDPAKWRTGLTEYRKVRYREVYPGVELVYYGNQRELEFDFVVAPGADPGNIRLAIEGARIAIDDRGDALLRSDDSEIRLRKPHLYQQVGEQKIDIGGRYVLKGRELRFAVANYHHDLTLTIDPQLAYSTYLGGSGSDGGTGIAVDSFGNAYVVGTSFSVDFPTLNPIQPKFGGQVSDVFITKLNATGTALLYSTYLSGSFTDGFSDIYSVGNAIAVDFLGDAYITGSTSSSDFPVTPGAFQPVFASKNLPKANAFVAELSPRGDALVYSTYLGGNRFDVGFGIAVDSSGNAYVSGETGSTNFPVTPNGFQTTFAGGTTTGGAQPTDAFVTKLNAAGSALAYSTYLGGSGDEYAAGIAVDASGNAYVTGATSSTNFPTNAPFQAVYGGGPEDVFVTKLNAAGSLLVYSTYLGGSGDDHAAGIAVDASGNAYVTGTTTSTNFPTNAPFQTAYGGGPEDVFVTKLNPAGSALAYSTYLGGSGDDYAAGIAVDASGNAYVTGTTTSTNFPTNAPFQAAYGGGPEDVFATELNAAGNGLVYSTYLGGSGDDFGGGIAVDNSGSGYLTGGTSSTNFPLSSPLQSTNKALSSGGNNAFIAKLSNPPAGTAPTSTTLSSSPSTSVYGQNVMLTAEVSSANGVPTGTVSFLDGGVSVGSGLLSGGQATLALSTLTAGSHSIIAAYGGDPTFAASSSAPLIETVSKASTTSTLSSSLPNSYYGQAVMFTATVSGASSGPSGPSGNVAFQDGQTTLNTIAVSSTGTASFTTSTLAPGPHSITAVYSGDASFTGSTSTALVFPVFLPPQAQPSAVIPVGAGPIAAAINGITHTMFVANQGSNDVTAIDTRTNTVLALSIPVGKAPSAIAVNTVTDQVYVANRDSASVTVIDGATYSTTSVVAAAVDQLTNPPSLLPFHAVALAVNEQTNQVYVGSSDCDLAVIDGATNNVFHPGNNLCGPVAVAVSPLTQLAYVAESQDDDIEAYQAFTLLGNFDFSNFQSAIGGSVIQPVALAANPPAIYAADSLGKVDVIDETTNTSVAEVAVAPNAYAIAANPADRKIYVASQSPAAGQPATVTGVDTTNNSVVATYTVGQSAVPAHIPAPNKMAVDSGANLIYVANEASNDVTVIDGAHRSVLATVPVGVSPSALLVDQLKCSLYVANFGSGTVTVFQPSITGPAVCLSTGSLVFGGQLVGTTSPSQTVTLTNVGNSDLQITGISLLGESTDFAETDNCTPMLPATSKTIAAGQSCTIQGTFSPTTFGVRTAQMSIADNASSSPQLISLEGDGNIPATVLLTVNPTTLVYGQAPALTAQVSGSGTPNIPGRTITFAIDGKPVHTSVLGSDGSVNLQLPTPLLLAVGLQHAFTASYSGDKTFAPAQSPAVMVLVNKAPSVTSELLFRGTTPNRLEASVSPVYLGGAAPTGTVIFQEGQNTFASITLGARGIGTTPVLLSPGVTHQVTALYQGDGNFLPSSSAAFPVFVYAATTITLTSSSPSVAAGNGVSFTATVKGSPAVAGHPVAGTIIFRDGQTVFDNEPTNGSATTPLFATGPGSGFPVGQHSITAEYQDASGYYLGVKSKPLAEVVTPPVSGGGTATPTCACSLTGQYQVPATPVTPDDDPLVSPQGSYTVTPTINGGVLSQIDVFDLSGKDILQLTPANGTLSWGFSPDEDRLVTHSSQVDRITVYDLSVKPPRVVVDATSPAGAVSLTSFSSSGRYFLVNYVYNQQFVPATGEVALYQVQGVASPLLLYDQTFGFQLGADPDVTSTETLGFSPNNPETSFVYSFLDSNGQVQVNLVGLATSTKAPLATDTLSKQPAAFWEFSSCGDTFAVVKQISPLGQTVTVQIDFMSATTGKNLPGNGTQVTIGTQKLTLLCTSTQQEYQVGNQTPVVLSPNTACTNTPAGSNVTVIPQDAASGQAPVTVTFSNVAQPGGTTSLIATNVPPNSNFKLGTDPNGNPIGGFDLTTNASFTPPATVCISYAHITFSGGNLALMHYDGGTLQSNGQWTGGTWHDYTILPIDTAHQIICGKLNSFSPFGVFEQIGSATTTSATITVPSITYGTPASVTVSVNSPSQSVSGNVTLSVDGGVPITVALSNGFAIFDLGVLNAGSHSLSANFAAQGSFAASTANGTLVVNPAPLTLTANSFSIAYGARSPNLIFSASGFVNGDTNASLTTQPTLSTTTTAASGVGNYPISISSAVDPNYSISYVPGTLTVTPVSLTITANSVSKVYGATLPILGFSASGFVNGDTNASLTTQPTLSTAATAASGVGNYPISISGAVDPNYSIAYVQGTLTVTPAALTVTAANAQRVYGAANPVLTGAITGIQNGDNIGAIYATAATPASPVGTYAIAPTLVDPTGRLGNYIVTLVNGVLTVIQASTTTTLSASPNPSTFGQSVTLTATVAPIAPGAGIATGKVTFFDGTVPLGTSTLNRADTATFTTSSLAAGSQSFTASFSGDSNFSASSSSAVSDQVQCGVLISLSPSTVPLGGTVTVSGKVISCSTTTQMVVVKFALSGPSQPNSCSITKSEMFTTPPFPLPPKTSQTVSFPFKLPSNGVCPGAYSITATTLVNGVAMDTSTASLTITAH